MSVNEQERTQLAREVVALGEELFALALRGYERQKGEETPYVQGDKADVNEALGLASEESETYPVDEIREAAGVFFRVLRGLLAVGGDESE